MSISKEQWLATKEELSSFMPRLCFMLNGHEILIQKEGCGELKQVLAIYIDGKICSAYSSKDSDKYLSVSLDVWSKKSVWLYSPSKQKAIRKRLSKRLVKEIYPDLEKKGFYYIPYFTSIRTLIGQYKKLEGLELVKLGTETFGEQAA
ncbi:MAG: hypothetical protein JKY50_20645 [Oleispira sp.]|nr:hypothetical protein [Oleispira sp.]